MRSPNVEANQNSTIGPIERRPLAPISPPKVKTSVEAIASNGPRAFVTGGRERLAPWLAALISGVLLGLPLSVEKFSAAFAPLSWCWLVPLFVCPGPAARASRLFACAAVAGATATAIGIYGIAYVIGGLSPAYFLVSGLLWALPFGGFLLMRPLLGAERALWTLPLVWPLSEWAIQHVDGLPPFLHLSGLQDNAAWLIQFADLTGEWGVTAWVVLFNVLLFRAVRRSGPVRFKACATVVACMTLPALGYSAWSIGSAGGGKTYRGLAVQPFLDPERAGAVPLLEQETYLTDVAVAKQKPDLILWPEGAIDFPLTDYPDLRRFVTQAVADWGTPLLTGSFQRRGRQIFGPAAFAMSNAAFLLSPGPPGSGPESTQVLPPHLKRRLAPFGEAMPYAQRFPWLNRVFRKWHRGEAPLLAGRDFQVFRYRTDNGDELRIGPVICWESLYPGDLAELVRRRAQVLVVMANDFDWGASSISYLHASIDRLRAIETHRPVIRVSTTGPSLAVDGRGRELAATAPQRQATMTFSFAPDDDFTFYSQHPNWFPVLCAAALGICAAAAACQQIPRRKGLR